MVNYLYYTIIELLKLVGFLQWNKTVGMNARPQDKWLKDAKSKYHNLGRLVSNIIYITACPSLCYSITQTNTI